MITELLTSKKKSQLRTQNPTKTGQVSLSIVVKVKFFDNIDCLRIVWVELTECISN